MARISLYPGQISAVGRLRPGHILCGGVGSGKSRTAVAYFLHKICGGGELDENGLHILSVPRPRGLCIITTAKKRDSGEWEDELRDLPIFVGRPDISFGGIELVVDSWNSIKKYTSLQNWFFVFDEQRLVGKGAWVKSFYKIARSNQWVLLSATPGDTWHDYVAVMVANGYYRNKTDFETRHVIFDRYSKYPKIDRYVDEARLRRIRADLLVMMDVERSTQRVRYKHIVKYDKDEYRYILKHRWNLWKDWPVQNAAELVQCLRRSLNSYSERLDETVKLLRKHERVIIFYNYNYELELIRERLDGENIFYSEWNGHKHEPVPSSDEHLTWAYLVQYTAGSEGWNCTTCDTTIFYSLNYSFKVHEQAEGRTDRVNTPYNVLHYYYLMCYSGLDRSIWDCVKTKRIFQERGWSESRT